MKHLRLAFIVIAIAALSGCGIASASKRNRILKTATAADFGPPPPANHQAVEMALIRERLKDPDSAKFQFGQVMREAIQPKLASPDAVPVWVSGWKVNAKNSYGGYNGFEPWAVAWKNGRPYAMTNFSSTQVGDFTVPNGWQYFR